MAIEIKETVHGTWLVNGVEVYETSQGTFEAKGDLSDEDRKKFLAHLKKNNSKILFSDLEHLKADLKAVDEKLEMLINQKTIVDGRKDTLSKESTMLRNHYHKMIEKYQTKKQELMNQLPVEYTEIIS